jgi:hypothetical protein
MPATAVRLGRGPSRALLTEPTLTLIEATLGLEAGIALAVSLADDGLDLLAIGAIGVGADVASAALLGAGVAALLLCVLLDVATGPAMLPLPPRVAPSLTVTPLVLARLPVMSSLPSLTVVLPV